VGERGEGEEDNNSEEESSESDEPAEEEDEEIVYGEFDAGEIEEKPKVPLPPRLCAACVRVRCLCVSCVSCRAVTDRCGVRWVQAVGKTAAEYLMEKVHKESKYFKMYHT
jgi:hypothetical protein